MLFTTDKVLLEYLETDNYDGVIIVRGKTKSPVEFGAKFDLSIDDNGLGRIEKISYDAYNESTVLKEAAERFRERTGHYPERIISRPDLSYQRKQKIL